jgi:hypothetical protein
MPRRNPLLWLASMNLLKRHHDHIPLPWIFGYTAYRLDHRDQLFQPICYAAWKYLASLPYNRHKPLRFLGEWLTKGGANCFAEPSLSLPKNDPFVEPRRRQSVY